MDNTVVRDILNELLNAEARSLVPRLREYTLFVSWASADELRLVDRIVAEQREHQAWLFDAIVKLGGEPTPVRADMRSTLLHFLDLHHVLPRVLADKRRLAALFADAASGTGGNPVASQVIAKIADRHRVHLQQLEKFASRVLSPAGS